MLQLLEFKPKMKQFDLAAAAGASLGKTNYCMTALLEKGLIKMKNFKNNKLKLAYSYLLTSSGIAEKAVLARRFLKRKMGEYGVLKAEIELLKHEVLDR